MDPDNKLGWGTGRKAIIREKDYNITSPFYGKSMSKESRESAMKTILQFACISIVVIMLLLAICAK